MAQEETKKSSFFDPEQLKVHAKKAAEFVDKNRKAVIACACAAVTVAVVISGIVYFQKRAEEEAQVLFGRAVARLEEANRSGDASSVYEELKPEFREVFEKYGSTEAGRAALLKYAELCFRTGDYENSVQMYKKSLEEYKGDPWMKCLVLNGLAYAYEGINEYEKAAECFSRILKSDSGVMKDQVLFNLARLYGRLGKQEKQREAYKQLVSEHKDSMYYQLAKEELAG